MIEKLGKYNIVGELGQGAMGTVYKGEDPLIGRVVAIKTINKSALAGEAAAEAATRFKQEAQAAGRLSHPNIVVVYDYGEEDGSAFIAMAFVEGRELKNCFDRNELFGLEDIVRIMDQLLDALNFAHINKIVHRDIKPGNIIINDKGHIMITDFGIARLENSDLTQVGATMGTPNYMAPEQCMGQRIDGRADIFSAAVILYQLLTGEKPFAGPNIASIMHKILKVDPVPPSELNMQIPSAFDSVVAKGLAKRPEDRFATADEFRKAVQAAVGGVGVENVSTDGGTPAPEADATIMVDEGAVEQAVTTGNVDVGGDDKTVVAVSGSGNADYDDGTVFATTTDTPSVNNEPNEPEDGTIALESLGGVSSPASQPAPVRTVPPAASASSSDAPESEFSKKKLIALLVGAGLIVVVVAAVFLFSGDKTENTGVVASKQSQPVTPQAHPKSTSPKVAEVKTVTPIPPARPVSLVSPGTVYVETVPARARVTVDGVVAQGVTPLSLDLSSGNHEFIVSNQGYFAVPVDVDVKSGDMVPLVITLHRK